jgi:hypothetical protein
MPWTFAHPAAVLPIKRFCPATLDFSAMVIGSMIPDLGYYIPHSNMARLAHSFLGSFLVCLPAGLAFWGIFHLLRKPLCFVLPQPHRSALAPLAARRILWRPRTLAAAGVSVLLGAWTHIVWDSFTHNTWLVKLLPLLQEPVFRMSAVEFPWYFLLQLLSTLAGGAILIAAYCSWLRLNPGWATAPSVEPDDRWRYVLLATIAALALLIAAPSAVQAAARFAGYPALRVLVFRMIVDTTTAFLTLVSLVSLVLYAARRARRTAG